MAAAIIKLDALPDAVGATAENHDLEAGLRIGFVFVLVSGIEVRCEGFEFRGAGVHALEDRSNAVARSLQAHGSGGGAPDLSELFVARPVALHFAQQIFRRGLHGDSCGAAVHGRQFLDLLDEPGINLRQIANFLRGKAALHGREQPMNAVRPGRSKLFAQERSGCFSGRAPRSMRFERPNAFLERFLERPPDGHHFADRLHLCAQSGVRSGEFLELPFRDFDDDVVDRRLKARRRFLRDVVRNLIKRHAHRESRGDLRNREAGRLAGQRRAARDARIHLDDDHPAVFRIDCELDVRPAGFHTDFTHDGCGGVPHALVFLVRQRLRRSDCDRVARVHAHGIEILDRADHHEVVAEIPHHLELVFLPAEDRLFNKGFVDRAQIQRVGRGFAELFFVVGDRAARSAKRERWANHQGKAELVAQAHRVLRVIDQRRGGYLEPDFATRVFEPESVLGNFDRSE